MGIIDFLKKLLLGLIDICPFLGTIKHAFFDDPPKGSAPADYIDCKTTMHTCEGMGSNIAIMNCGRCMQSKFFNYLLKGLGLNFAGDILEGASGVIMIAFADSIKNWLLEKGFKKAGGFFVPGLGLLLMADALIDLAITIYKLVKMYEAYQAAKAQYCVCPPV